MRRRALIIAAGGTVVALGAAAFFGRERLAGVLNIAARRMRGRRSLDEALREVGPAARARLHARFTAAGRAYPPGAVTLVGLKAERRLEIWAADRPGAAFARIADLPVIAASGGPGPKLREGDRQVPEGVYPITYLNPNSAFHLSLRVGYPSADDRARASAEGREDLGGDIMIHGAGGSIGCLAMENEVIEEIFTLAADVGIEAVRVILAPEDFRGRAAPAAPPGAPVWTAERYAEIAEAWRGLGAP